MPNNKEQALGWLLPLSCTLKKKPEMQKYHTEFMVILLRNNHAEHAPPLEPNKEVWCLASFGVYHPQKPGQIMVMFDSTAQFKVVPLNEIPLVGPDFNNSLLGVLMCFRTDPMAVIADIKQMFHSFIMRDDHLDCLWILWFRDHQLDKEILEYHMRVHIFGNCPSPAVAIYG